MLIGSGKTSANFIYLVIFKGFLDYEKLKTNAKMFV